MVRTPKSSAPAAFLRRGRKLMESLESRLLLATWTPADGTALNNILNLSATHQQTGQTLKLGDTIILTAGQNYMRPESHGASFVLRNLGTGTDYVTIRTSAMDKLPGEGVRATPADAPAMARMQTKGSNASVINTQAYAHHYKFIGIEFVGPSNNTDLTALITLGSDGSDQSTEEVVPHHLVFDRCYMRPNTPEASIRRGIALNSAHTDIINSWIEEMHQPGADSQAIGGWNGIGPFNIINNRLEGGSENIMFGGSTSRIRPATDVVIRGNHVIKPLHWKTKNYNVKNLFELKHGSNFLIENNIFENNWTQGQTGTAIVLKLGDLETSPNNVTEDIIFRNNIVRNSEGGISLQGRDYAANYPNGDPGLDPGGLVRRLTFTNNLFYNIDGNVLLAMTQGPKDVVFDHNTLINGTSSTPIYVDTPNYPTSGFKFTNNIMAHNTYGVNGTGTSGYGNGTFDNPAPGPYFGDPAHVFTKNILMSSITNIANSYTDRPGNFFPINWTAVGFQSMTAHNYRLRDILTTGGANPHRNAGTDGKDLGADIDLLEAGVAGVASGVFKGATGGGGVSLPDRFVLEMIGTDGRRFRVTNSAEPAGTAPYIDVLAYYQDLLFLTGGDDDRLTISYAAGAPIPTANIAEGGTPARGVFYDGGDGAGDSLIITGNNSSAASYAPGGSSGNGKFTAQGDIHFLGNESLSASGFSSFTLITPSAADNLIIDTALAGKYRINGTSGGVAMAPVDVSSTIPLTLDLASNDAGGGNDVVTVAAGSGAIAINAGTGSNTFNADGGNFSLNTSLGVGGVNLDVNIANVGTNVSLPAVQQLRNLSITGGGKASLPTGGAASLSVTNLAITGSGSQLNLADNLMAINYTGPSPLGADATYTGVSKLLRDGRNGGAWNGDGIVTSMTDAQAPGAVTTLGVAEAKASLGLATSQTAAWNGQTVDDTTLLIRYTQLGDADLNGRIDADDYFRIDLGYAAGATGFYNGDFDYSQSINGDDYFAIDNNYSAAPALAATQSSPEGESSSPSTPASATSGAELPSMQDATEEEKKSTLEELNEQSDDLL